MNTALPPAADARRARPGPTAARDAPAPTWPTTPFGLYVHVPFCATRCGYCDFNTYTSDELGPGANRAEYAGDGDRRAARRPRGSSGPEPADGRPRCSSAAARPPCCPADDLAAVLAAVRELFPVAADVEVTTEANPESVDARVAGARCATAGFTRVSLGMQSAAEHVLAVLDRRHTPGRAVEAAREARAAGFEHVNLDLIYGTPGETDADWAASLDAVLAAPVDHVQRLRADRRAGHPAGPPDRPRRAADARRRRARRPVRAGRRGRCAAPGFDWYEVSNWATRDRRPAAGTTSCTGPNAQLVGHRPRRAQPRRRPALVERQAPRRLRRPAGPRREPGRRTPSCSTTPTGRWRR